MNSQNVVNAISSFDGETNQDRQNEMLSANSFPIRLSENLNKSKQITSNNSRAEIGRVVAIDGSGMLSDKNNTIKQFNNFIGDGGQAVNQYQAMSQGQNSEDMHNRNRSSQANVHGSNRRQ